MSSNSNVCDYDLFGIIHRSKQKLFVSALEQDIKDIRATSNEDDSDEDGQF